VRVISNHFQGLVPGEGLADFDRMTQYITAQRNKYRADFVDVTDRVVFRHHAEDIFSDERDDGFTT